MLTYEQMAALIGTPTIEPLSPHKVHLVMCSPSAGFVLVHYESALVCAAFTSSQIDMVPRRVTLDDLAEDVLVSLIDILFLLDYFMLYSRILPPFAFTTEN